ncbi:phenylacetic acid degradation bifunctional protein PaaZ [Aurantibacillus circumpalustris]|uniref:phenylacetic acid degradation bifunctional protein PaaZ n=1 Tax=Aurantibacillus circumpalustris TaxID=3036359 RepID=UPI00295AB01E|nr:phenylacetic acid degradation bifunctional protein PaaZ [Aurantibacillus circumpalustris]
MNQLHNYACGKWVAGTDKGQDLFNAITGETIATTSSKGIDFGQMCDYARNVGGPKLRKMTFQERGLMLKALAMHLLNKKEDFYKVSWATGATRIDSWVDIEGGIGNLFSYASLRRQFPNESYCYDGDVARLSKNNTFIGHHICVPKEGVAIHINAFNFPVWGMLEKVAVNWLAGVPAIVKPATVTSFLTEAVVKEIIASKILPEGALQLICGSANGILDHVMNQDVVTFTGSASTGKMLKAHPRLLQESVHFNMEADSLNCCVLGTDVTTAMPEFDIFIKEIAREITTKAGQKCTAVRRIIVPENMVEDVHIALGKRLAQSIIGDPNVEGVRMGSLAGQAQLIEVKEKVELLSKTQKIIIGDFEKFEVKGADKHKGAFMPPIIFLNEKPFTNTDCHSVEAFGPVSTIMPYKTIDEAIELSKMGKGSLVSSIITADDRIARMYTIGAACMHGRILVLNNECAKESTGHGSPMPLLVHGGPGRAGGGEEMGGKRGVFHYLQRTAIQGSPTTITHILNQYQQGAKQIEKDIHPFRQYFEDLEIGETLITAKHTVTEADVVNFANVSGDHFYAHTDVTSLDGTIFTGRVAHGYYILSKAAGLFVNAKKGPVLLNYGIDECRFTKPVYMGSTIGVRFTCKEKIVQEKKNEEDVAKGIVKWLVDVYDETGETVAIATILTMVKMRNQD